MHVNRYLFKHELKVWWPIVAVVYVESRNYVWGWTKLNYKVLELERLAMKHKNKNECGITRQILANFQLSSPQNKPMLHTCVFSIRCGTIERYYFLYIICHIPWTFSVELELWATLTIYLNKLQKLFTFTSFLFKIY